MQTPMPLAVHSKLPRQRAMALDRPVLNGMTANTRSTAVRRLARLSFVKSLPTATPFSRPIATLFRLDRAPRDAAYACW